MISEVLDDHINQDVVDALGRLHANADYNGCARDFIHVYRFILSVEKGLKNDLQQMA